MSSTMRTKIVKKGRNQVVDVFIMRQGGCLEFEATGYSTAVSSINMALKARRLPLLQSRELAQLKRETGRLR